MRISVRVGFNRLPRSDANHVHILVGLSIRLQDEPGHENLQDVMHWFKSTSHQRYRAGVKNANWRPYDRQVWQEGFHDHIVRSEIELETLRKYIATNVEMWEKDRFYEGFQD